jgi:peptide subunit release factor 1 (eRF1)
MAFDDSDHQNFEGMMTIKYQLLCPNCDEEFTYLVQAGETPKMIRCRLCQEKIMADQFDELGYIFPAQEP